MQLSIQGDRSTSFSIALGLCLDLLRAKSEGPVSMEIPLGLIPRLMTKGESAWHQVKIQGSREKFPSGVFRRCNLGNEKGPDTSTRGARPVGSPNPDPASHVLQVRRDPVPNYRLLPEFRYRSRAWNGRPLVDTHYFSPVREALFNTLRKDVHRGQKDSVIGTQTTYALVNENHLDRIRVKQQCRNQAAPCLERIHTRPPAFPKEGEIRCLLLTETSDLYYSKIVRLSFFFLFLLFTSDFRLSPIQGVRSPGERRELWDSLTSEFGVIEILNVGRRSSGMAVLRQGNRSSLNQNWLECFLSIELSRLRIESLFLLDKVRSSQQDQCKQVIQVKQSYRQV